MMQHYAANCRLGVVQITLPMPKSRTDLVPHKHRLSVEISELDDAELLRVLGKLQGMPEASLTRILMHFAIRRAGDAIATALAEKD
jgi:hypothetical protein